MKGHYISLFFLMYILTSCDPGSLITSPVAVPESRQKENIYYVPSASNAPMLMKKNDLSFTALRSAGNNYTGYDLQAGFAPAKNFGLIASFSHASNNDGFPQYMVYNRFEGGAGYIRSLGKGWNVDAYGGIGSGKIVNYHYTGTSRLRLTNLFVQPSIFYFDAKHLQAGFTSKFSGLNYDIIDTLFSNASEPFSTKQLIDLSSKPWRVIWEPSLLVRAGWKNFLFHLSYTYSAEIGGGDLYRSKDNFSFGFSVRFNTTSRW